MIQDILKLFSEGMDTYDIARKIGKRESWVYNTLHCARENILVTSVPKPKKLVKYAGHPGKRSAWD